MKKALIASLLIGGIWGNISDSIVRSVAAQTPPTVQPNAPTTPSKQIELVDAGAEPRRELKFRPIANSQQNITMTMGMSMDMLVGEKPLPKTPIPKMIFEINSKIGRVDPNGDIHCSFTYGDVKAVAEQDTPPAMLAAIQKQLKNLAGIKIEMVVGSNGALKTKNLILPQSIDPAVKQTLVQFDRSLDQISTRLPAERVGLGAKWRVNEALQVGGIRFTQSSTYEIVKLDETGMTIRTQISQSAPSQDLPMPGVSSDVTAKLTSVVSTGDGNSAIRFDSLLPTGGKFSIGTDSKTSIRASSKEPPTNMTTKIAIDLSISSK